MFSMLTGTLIPSRSGVSCTSSQRTRYLGVADVEEAARLDDNRLQGAVAPDDQVLDLARLLAGLAVDLLSNSCSAVQRCVHRSSWPS
jgi:hypothetical protein